ncbi:hypothetical protein ACVWYG_001045 [Pedobacter sp. UYEF25]
MANEVSGQVAVIENNQEKAIGRIIINFYTTKGIVVAQTLSEIDGSYTYVGLLPGRYMVGIDEAQLKKLGMISSVLTSPILIKKEAEGSIVENVNFRLERLTTAN